MKFDWLSYLEVAQTLYNEVINTSNQGNSASIDEAKIRSCISRAYYSAFCSTRNYLRDFEGYSNLIGLTRGVHEYVIQELKSSKERDFIILGQTLERLRSLRNEVDYEDSIVSYRLIPKAEQALKNAKNLFQLLDKLTSNKKT
ncbi:HEPN domain-containing protein [Anabaena sp. UHCC 0187]|uniref:HEPN domain-containing protein n=1 Tax=Anabaena sp. UHCC 0187 TaxID=2590018 RepID=UPI001447713C|nr:HEPN domain-containing protein [Anabaena sp. UHCC 0187]MTJ11793.1 HEPN domain-containing protein [Anabaena sp. UHCC 0187]